ncbi:MAG: isochorismate synthase [Gemmatimonadota bacterium]|nr:isochorismate synthase [Gemmatimonadota bacterium]
MGRTGIIIDVRANFTSRHGLRHAPEERPAGRLASFSVELAGASPLDLLRASQSARGFWSHGERWVAHAGIVATVGAEPGPERFEQVRHAAAVAGGDAGPSWPEGGDPRLIRRPRFFGGFSFRDTPGASRLWRGFPSALFHLPAVELDGDAEGVAHLHVRALGRVGESDEALYARLEARAFGLAARLSVLHGRTDGPAPSARSELRANESDREAWDAAVEHSLRAIHDGAVRKVVLARTLDVPDPNLDPLDVLDHLWADNRDSHVFYFEPQRGRVLIGAAPETIATVRSGVFRATAVAGTVRRGASDEEREALALQLLASAKDREEHQILVEDVVQRLEHVATGVRAEENPHVLVLPAVQHLETKIRARLVDDTTVLDALSILHPTPSVCGEPRGAALELLAHEEPFERGWYAGPVGWFDLEGNGMFSPALRSAVLSERGWRLFAGAGIVAGSRPEAEWLEAGIKLGPVLRALHAAAAAT